MLALQKFLHQASFSNSNSSLTRSSTTFCLKLSLESLMPSANCAYSDENSQLCVNLFLSKDINSNSIDTNYYLWYAIFCTLSLDLFNRCTGSVGSKRKRLLQNVAPLQLVAARKR